MPPEDEPTRLSSPADDAATRLESDRGKSPSSGSASSGWLSSSDAIDHGRFPPGTLLGGRYRIVGRLGRGPGVVTVSMIVFIMLRFGLLSTLTFFVANFLLNATAITLDAGKWFFPTSTMMLLIVASMAVYGFYASRGGEPLLGRRLLD